MPDWNLRIHWNPLCKWIRHFISRFSGGFMSISTSPSTDRRSDPSGETTINGVPSFLWHTHCRHLPHKKCQVLKENQHNFSNHRRNDIDLVCASILHSLVWWCFVQLFSNLRPNSSKTCRTHYFFSKKHFMHFSEHFFGSIHQLTCLHHVQRITATVLTSYKVSVPLLWCPRYDFSRDARCIRILHLELYNAQGPTCPIQMYKYICHNHIPKRVIRLNTVT